MPEIDRRQRREEYGGAMSHLESNLRSVVLRLSDQPIRTTARRDERLWSSLLDVSALLDIQVPLDFSTDLQFQHIQFKPHQEIHAAGQAFEMLYLVNSGFIKTMIYDDLGNEQVLSFPMRGDLFGIDGIHGRRYTSEAVALTDCDVILIPFRKFVLLGRRSAEMESAMFTVLSRELAREQAMIRMLGAMGAEGRLARFLAWLSDRFSAMGYSGKEFNLRMSRQEIGSYLGMTLETVSRTFSLLDESGLVSVSQRSIIIHNLPALRTLRRVPRVPQ